jgi:hypothetical protein
VETHTAQGLALEQFGRESAQGRAKAEHYAVADVVLAPVVEDAVV